MMCNNNYKESTFLTTEDFLDELFTEEKKEELEFYKILAELEKSLSNILENCDK